MNGIRVGDKSAVTVGDFFDLVGQSLSVIFTDDLHKSRSNIGNVIERRLFANDFLVKFIVLIDTPLNLVFFSGDSFHVLDFLLGAVQPFFKSNKLVVVLFGNAVSLIEQGHTVIGLAVDFSEFGLDLFNFAFNASPFGRISAGGAFLTHFDKVVHGLFAVKQKFLDKLLFLDLGLDDLVIG